MHWYNLLSLLLNCLWPPPVSRSPDGKTSKLANWADWGLFTLTLLITLVCGSALLLSR
jgi:hypothetical protein